MKESAPLLSPTQSSLVARRCLSFKEVTTSRVSVSTSIQIAVKEAERFVAWHFLGLNNFLFPI